MTGRLLHASKSPVSGFYLVEDSACIVVRACRPSRRACEGHLERDRNCLAMFACFGRTGVPAPGTGQGPRSLCPRASVVQTMELLRAQSAAASKREGKSVMTLRGRRQHVENRLL